MTVKFVQITTVPASEDEHAYLVALDSDGRVWVRTLMLDDPWRWVGSPKEADDGNQLRWATAEDMIG